jgi:hypothetical protein
MEGYNKAGKPEVAEVDIAYFDRPITAVIAGIQAGAGGQSLG